MFYEPSNQFDQLNRLKNNIEKNLFIKIFDLIKEQPRHDLINLPLDYAVHSLALCRLS